MELKATLICCGCLNNGRRMVEISETKLRQCFLEIINEITVKNIGSKILQLCFECAALLLKFTKYKLQVVSCYKIFQNFIKNSTSGDVKPFNRLHCQKLYHLTTPELQQDNDEGLVEVPVDFIKVETEKEDCTHDVDINQDDLSNYEDEKPLVKFKAKKKKLNGVIRKKRGTEYLEVELNSVEIEEERRVLALSDDYVNAMFRCEKCVTSFPNEDDLRDHHSTKHELNASNFKCKICTCTFSTEISYNYHTNKHTRRYQCTVCSERCTSKRSALKHYNVTHCHRSAMEFDLDENNSDSNDRNVIKNENLINAQGESFPCEFCSKVFKWKTSLRKHLETHRIETGQKRKPYCAPCRLSFTTTPNLQKHVRTSSKHKIQLQLRKLNENSESNTEKSVVEEIKSSVTNSRLQFPCSHCDKRFLWRGNLLRHLHSHVARAKGDLVCKPCNKTFSSIATYQQHMKISKKHVSENDFKYMCSECGKRFPTKSHLRDHINWEHLKNYLYTCDVCRKVFKNSNTMYLHKQAVHNKDSVGHLCDHCGKAFPNNAKLRNHILGVHSGGAGLQCAWCDRRFSWHSCLSRHVRLKHRKASGKVS